MSSPIYIPSSTAGSTGTPVSVSVITSSYTVPAGRFARVVGECDSGGIITINGVNSVTTSGPILVNTTSGNNAVSSSYTVPAGFSFAGRARSQGGVQIGVFGSGATVESTIELGPGGVVSAVANGSGSAPQISGVSTPSAATNRQAEFSLPAGTVISGTGSWRAVIMLF